MEDILFLSSGLFLGWSLGANDAANVFGTAVGTRMVKFRSAAIVCSIFIILGATISGAGAAHTLGRLGAVNALAGSFTVALAAALFQGDKIEGDAVICTISGGNADPAMFARALTTLDAA